MDGVVLLDNYVNLSSKGSNVFTNAIKVNPFSFKNILQAIEKLKKEMEKAVANFLDSVNLYPFLRTRKNVSTFGSRNRPIRLSNSMYSALSNHTEGVETENISFAPIVEENSNTNSISAVRDNSFDVTNVPPIVGESSDNVTSVSPIAEGNVAAINSISSVRDDGFNVTNVPPIVGESSDNVTSVSPIVGESSDNVTSVSPIAEGNVAAINSISEVRDDSFNVTSAAPIVGESSANVTSVSPIAEGNVAAINSISEVRDDNFNVTSAAPTIETNDFSSANDNSFSISNSEHGNIDLVKFTDKGEEYFDPIREFKPISEDEIAGISIDIPDNFMDSFDLTSGIEKIMNGFILVPPSNNKVEEDAVRDDVIIPEERVEARDNIIEFPTSQIIDNVSRENDIGEVVAFNSFASAKEDLYKAAEEATSDLCEARENFGVVSESYGKIAAERKSLEQTINEQNATIWKKIMKVKEEANKFKEQAGEIEKKAQDGSNAVDELKRRRELNDEWLRQFDAMLGDSVSENEDSHGYAKVA